MRGSFPHVLHTLRGIYVGTDIGRKVLQVPECPDKVYHFYAATCVIGELSPYNGIRLHPMPTGAAPDSVDKPVSVSNLPAWKSSVCNPGRVYILLATFARMCSCKARRQVGDKHVIRLSVQTRLPHPHRRQTHKKVQTYLESSPLSRAT